MISNFLLLSFRLQLMCVADYMPYVHKYDNFSEVPQRILYKSKVIYTIY